MYLEGRGQGAIPEFSGRTEENRMSFKIAGLLAEICTRDFTNLKQEFQQLSREVGYFQVLYFARRKEILHANKQ